MSVAYGVVSLFCGLGGKTLGFLRARGREGSRFESVGAFDVSEVACRNLELLTGASAQAVDLGDITPAQLAERCSRRPDVVIMSPPCKGWSGCLPEAMQIGNAVPPPTAQAIAEQVLDVLDAGQEESFRLSSAGVWVAPTERAGR